MIIRRKKNGLAKLIIFCFFLYILSSFRKIQFGLEPVQRREKFLNEEEYLQVNESENVLTPRNGDSPGEMGEPYKIDMTDNKNKVRVDAGWSRHAYNEYVSDLISVERSLPDLRDNLCKAHDRLLPTLPQASVIVCFHNEGWSALLRTVHSILNRSPQELLKEIILVDDASDLKHLKTDLESYMSKHQKVKIVRAEERVGLIRARLIGASKASGPVLIFLDSHIECTGWMEPLLNRISRNSTFVICPVIDAIDK